MKTLFSLLFLFLGALSANQCEPVFFENKSKAISSQDLEKSFSESHQVFFGETPGSLDYEGENPPQWFEGDEEFLCGVCEEPVVFQLDLENSVRMALKQNRQLLGVLDSLRNSKMNLDFEETAFDINITPDAKAGYVGGGKVGRGVTVGGGVNITKKFVNGTKILLNPALTKVKKNWRSHIRVMLTQPILKGFGAEYNLASIRRSQYLFRSASRNYYVAQVGLIVRVITTLYEMIKSEGFIELHSQSVERLRGFKDAACLKEKIGLCDSLDVYRAEIELKRAEEALNQAQERLLEVKDTIRDLLALPMCSEIDVIIPLEYHNVELCVDEAICTAFSNRLEIEQAEDSIQESERLVYMAKKNFLPELNMIVDYNNVGSHEYFTESFYNKRENTWGIGFGTSTNWDQNAEKNALAHAVMNREGAYRNMDQLKQNISTEVKKVLRNLRRIDIRIQLLEEQIATAEKEMSLSKIKFEHGLANNFDVIQSEKNLHSAYQSLLGAEIDHVITEFQLMGALGTLSNKPKIECR